MKLDVTHDEMFLLIVGLERLRDDQAAEAKRLNSVAHTWASPEFAHEQAAEYVKESKAAEELRQRLKETPEYKAATA